MEDPEEGLLSFANELVTALWEGRALRHPERFDEVVTESLAKPMTDPSTEQALCLNGAFAYVAIL